MKGFNQISYAVDNFPTQSATDTGQNVYNPVEGAFVISAVNLGGATDVYQPIMLFPNQNYVDDVLWSFTNLELLVTNAYVTLDDVDLDIDFLARVYCTRKLNNANIFSVSQYELISLEAGGVSSWDLSDVLEFNSVFKYFTFKIANGGDDIDDIGLYKGTFILF